MATRRKLKLVTPSDPVELTEIERIAVEGLMAREVAATRDVMAPIQEAYRLALTAIAERVGLPADAFDRTHQIKLHTLTIEERPRDLAG